MSVSKEIIMQTLNLDETDDTALIPAYIESAQQYIINAVGSDPKFYDIENVKYLFDTAVIALTSTYFTYRVALNETLTYPINLTLNSIIGQLRGLYATYSDGEVTDA
ncbi:phage gp6-like head-tail connector protein [Streptococcus thermophilus]|nr:phage gp6-like head-tail connector protein [Streptococcus thermophilus]